MKPEIGKQKAENCPLSAVSYQPTACSQAVRKLMPTPAGWEDEEWLLALESAARLPRPLPLSEREIAAIHQWKRREKARMRKERCRHDH